MSGWSMIRGLPLYVATTLEQFNAIMDELQLVDGRPRWVLERSARTYTMFRPDGSRCHVVAISSADNTPIEQAGLLVHEAMHIFQDWCEVNGEATPSAEFQAYSMQEIFMELAVQFEAKRG